MESTTFTAKGISDLLGTVPTLFGFHPEDSLIAIATHGPHNRFGLASAVALRWFARLSPAKRRDVIRLVKALRRR